MGKTKLDLFNDTPTIIRPSTGHLLADAWVATSTLQKSIRRGKLKPALEATSFLLGRNDERFWRRLVVIALEDIGIGDLEAVRQVLSAATHKTWRAENGGDWAVASELVQSLCLAPKSRDACELLVTADLHPRLKRLRRTYMDLSSHQLSDILATPENGLAERTLAAWLIAGTKRFPAYSLPEKDGSFAALLDVYRHLGASEEVLEVARLGSTRTQEGHPLTLPLVWLMATSANDITIEQTSARQAGLIRCWPAEAFDMHSRIGRSAITAFIRNCDSLSGLMRQFLPQSVHADFAGTLLFRLEGQVVDRRITYPGSRALLLEAEAAHITYSGFPENRATDALDTLQDHLDLLHSCRLSAAGVSQT